jgi:CheY-like chemotaxis protein
MLPRLLVLDDEETVRLALANFFEGKGYCVTAATNSREAIELADRKQFDLAIIDINLAGENGLELLRYFKANFPTLPVLMLTGMADSDDLIEQAMFRGASGFMRKTEPL